MATESGWSEDSAAVSDRAGPALDDSLAPVVPALEALNPLAALVPDSQIGLNQEQVSSRSICWFVVALVQALGFRFLCDDLSLAVLIL